MSQYSSETELGTPRFSSCCHHFSPIVTVLTFRRCRSCYPLGTAGMFPWIKKWSDFSDDESPFIQWCLSFLFLFLYFLSQYYFHLVFPSFFLIFLRPSFTQPLFLSPCLLPYFLAFLFPSLFLSQKLRKAALSFVVCPSVCKCVFLSIRPSVRMEQLGSHWEEFEEVWFISISLKSVEKIQVTLKSNMKTVLHLWS